MATSYRASATTLNASLKLTGSVKGTVVNRVKNYTIRDVNEFSTFDVKILADDSPVAIWGNVADDSRGSGTTDGADWLLITNTGPTAIELFEEYPVYSSETFTNTTCDYNDDATIAHDADALIYEGHLVTGTGIPTDAYIQSLNSSTSFELSAATTGGSVTDGTLTFRRDLEAADKYVSRILPPKSFVVIPTQRSVIYGAGASAANHLAFEALDKSSQKTDGNGYIKTTTFFDQPDMNGISPGTILAVFYEEAYQELGMTNATNKSGTQLSTTSTGLAVNTAYAFGLNIDGAGAADVAFTTHTSDVTWGSGAIGGNGVLSKINTALRDAYDAGTQAYQARVSLVDGDARFSSGSRDDAGTIALTTKVGGVATVFGVGSIPAVGNIDTAVTAANATDFTLHGIDPADALIDYGDGTGTRANGGTFRFIELDGTDKYKEGGLLEFFNCPPHASFKLWWTISSAHSGIADADGTGDNVIKGISARSLSPYIPGSVQVTVAV